MASRQKILFVIDHFQNPYAGTEGQLFKLITHLDRSLFDPELLVFSASEYLSSNPFPCDVKVLGRRRLASPATWLRLFRMAREYRERGFRLAHVYFNDPSIICPPVFALCGIKTLISRRDMGYWYTPLLERVLRMTGRFTAGAVVNSDAVGQLTREKERIQSQRLHVIYNGVVDGEIDLPGQEEGIPELAALKEKGAILAAIVANVRPIKRMGDAIEALAQLGEACTRAHLVIIGGGDSSHLRAQASALGVGERVHFLGSRSDVPACLRYIDIGLLCSESEGFSNAIVEYMRQGLPVICSNTGGNPEAVKDGETGFLYPVGDVPRLANLLSRLVMDEGERKALGARAQRHAEAEYSVAAMVRKHEVLYQRLQGNKHPA